VSRYSKGERKKKDKKTFPEKWMTQFLFFFVFIYLLFLFAEYERNLGTAKQSIHDSRFFLFQEK